jgi:hypothetical protein
LAKNGIEYFVKKRMKMQESKFDTFHLVKSGKDREDM